MYLGVDISRLKLHIDILQKELAVAKYLYEIIDQEKKDLCRNSSDLNIQRDFADKEINNILRRIDLLTLIIEKVSKQINETDNVLEETKQSIKKAENAFYTWRGDSL